MQSTYSEKLVSDANKYYSSHKIAYVKKIDPTIRFAGGGAFFSNSKGLDFCGVGIGGKNIEFEVKETRQESLRFDAIRMCQLDEIERKDSIGSYCFLLIYFSTFDEWYSLEWNEINKILNYSSIPIRYFRSFGYLIPNDNTWPDYMNPERHPRSNELMKDFPTWMPKIKEIQFKDSIQPKRTHEQIKSDTMKAFHEGVARSKKKQSFSMFLRKQK